eukprot:CAMPEP_0197511418 /NCGR_PEP_ID=MMETSP1312-20131121/63076_1 /TAXON_ID=464262 /ORGANISM="Genus nov. species nov., Strain RCC2335" /LENGTH=106 /DNA_ID=CAMNT_0043059445 /DNA_START=303 /DNA_END=620 /DNA_ORIENTATION=+
MGSSCWAVSFWPPLSTSMSSATTSVFACETSTLLVSVFKGTKRPPGPDEGTSLSAAGLVVGCGTGPWVGELASISMASPPSSRGILPPLLYLQAKRPGGVNGMSKG